MKFLESLLGALQVGAVLLLSPVLRAWYNRWGARAEEASRPLAGDELVPSPRLAYTRGITIQAPPESVWPWLAQIGQGRGGLYSYEGLENLVGCDIHNATEILLQFQDLKAGDLVRLGPPGYPCFAAAAVEPPRALVLVSADPKSGQPVTRQAQPGKGYSIGTWQFILEPQGEGGTRLLVRSRLDYSPDLAWIWRLTEPVAFVMERKMLLEIKALAEKGWRSR